jgi:hypothetical protein
LPVFWLELVIKVKQRSLLAWQLSSKLEKMLDFQVKGDYLLQGRGSLRIRQSAPEIQLCLRFHYHGTLFYQPSDLWFPRCLRMHGLRIQVSRQLLQFVMFIFLLFEHLLLKQAQQSVVHRQFLLKVL